MKKASLPLLPREIMVEPEVELALAWTFTQHSTENSTLAPCR